MTTPAQANPLRVRLTNVRVTFPKLFEPEKFTPTDKDDYYSASFLLTRDHPDLAALATTIRAAAVAKWRDKAEDTLMVAKAKDKLPIHDGDLKATKPYGAAYKGMFYVSARNNARTGAKPGVYDSVIDSTTGLARVILTANDKRAPYSGAYVDVLLDLFGYERDGGIGVGASIAGVQFKKDGDRLAGGAVAAADDFEAIPDATVAQAAVTGTGAKSLF
jgi:hypothetical protein